MTQSAAPLVVKRSFIVDGRKTSVSLEAPFWHAVQAIASKYGTTAAALVTAVNATRGEANLSSALRVYVLEYYQAIAEPADDDKA